MELYAVLDNQEHNQERDHIAAMTEEERLEWAFQESMKVDQHRRSTRPLNEEIQQRLHRVMFPADNACAFHCMGLIERKRRNEDNCLSADFSSSSCAVTQTFRETIVANISRQWEASVDTLPNWMWSHLMIDGSASVGDLAIRGLTVAAVSSMEQYKEHMSKQSSFGGWFEFAWFSLATNITFNMYDEDSCSVICSFYGKADSNTVTSRYHLCPQNMGTHFNIFVETSALQAPTPPSPGRSSESRYSMLGGYGNVDDADAKSQQTPRLNDLRKK